MVGNNGWHHDWCSRCSSRHLPSVSREKIFLLLDNRGFGNIVAYRLLSVQLHTLKIFCCWCKYIPFISVEDLLRIFIQEDIGLPNSEQRNRGVSL